MHSRTRARLLGLAVVGVGALNVASSFTPSLRSRLRGVLEVLTPEAAGFAAGAAGLLGIALVLLGRGVMMRRRLASQASLAVLLLSTMAHLAKGLDIEEASVTGALALGLAWNRRIFVVPYEPARWRGLAHAALAIVLLDWGYGLAGLLVRHRLVSNFTFPGAVREVGARLVGMSGPLRIGGRFGHWFPASLTVLGAASLAGFLLVALAPVAERAAASRIERERVRRMMQRSDGGTLDPFALRRDKRYVFSRDREAVLAYRYVNGVGLASGDPIGDPASFADAFARFVDTCERRGWRPAVLGARADQMPLYEVLGFRAMYLGDEAIIDVPAFSLEGRRMRNVRQSIAHAERTGITTDVAREGELDPTLRRALIGIAEAARAGAPERGFSMALGDMLTNQEPDCVVVVCRAADGRPLAFQRYVPCKGGRGMSLDLMRRDDDAPGGVNERMIVDAVEWARAHGVMEVSLNFAAFRGLIEKDADLSPVQAAQAWVIRRLNPYFQLESLRAFNAKFHPRWVQRYVVYRARADLAAVGLAALSAEAFLPFDRREERELAAATES